MHRLLLAMLCVVAAVAKDPLYEISGRIQSGARVNVSIFGAVTPYTADTMSDEHGAFHFRKLMAGSYTLAIYSPLRGEARLTVEVGPQTADPSGRVQLTLNLHDSDYSFSDVSRRNAVSAKQLSIPDRAWREYEQARKDLGRRDADAAEVHLEKAVEVAPQFATAWNTLGTIAYQTRKYDRAEQYFREALKQDPSAYEALVNLGGVLINLNHLDQARQYNQRAVSMRPNDALANSQLGMTYFELGEMPRAEKYLQLALDIDPAHFSQPQLLLARIHASQNKREQAAEDLESFLQHHPDSTLAPAIRQTLSKLRSESPRP